ncbi:MAG: class I SAM-dependent methyltransferase, partial [Arenicella sp.]|nr:class I SAM-dependent methyltransferase [Arenicella sp.]
ITISKQQVALAQELVRDLNVDIRFQDYRDLDEKFDRIYSIGMFEHVGFKNYQHYFEVVNRCLVDDGLFLLHTIGHSKTSSRVDPWIERYIFPNSVLPSAELIARHSSAYFAIEDWHNFGLDYHLTLLAWHRNIEAKWQELPDYDETFRRKWRYYLLSSAGAFKAYRNHLWQIVFSKGARQKPYHAVRSVI